MEFSEDLCVSILLSFYFCLENAAFLQLFASMELAGIPERAWLRWLPKLQNIPPRLREGRQETTI